MSDTIPAAEQPRESGPVAPHGPHRSSDDPTSTRTPERAADGRTAVRVFRLQRDHDVTGVSGTGAVADGVLWPDGTVSIRWRGPRPSTVNWQSLEDAEAIHGHGGATRIIWTDQPDTAPDTETDSPVTSTDTVRTGQDTDVPPADRHEQLANWLTANGIDPNDVPVDAELTIATEPDGTRVIRYEAFVRNSRGSLTLDERRQTVAVDVRTARLLVEPPAWWQPYEKPTREQAIAERDGAYRERAHLLAWLAALHPANAVITPADDVDEPGWQLLYLLIGGWQMSWHIAPRDTELFAHVEHVTPDDPRAQWDGHTTEQKYDRIQDHVARINRHRLPHECRDCLEHGGIGFDCNHLVRGRRLADSCRWCRDRKLAPGEEIPSQR